MAVNKEILLQEAQTLGIKDVEQMSYNELRSAVATVKKRIKLEQKAQSYGIVYTDMDLDALEAAVNRAEKIEKLFTKAEGLGIELTGEETLEELEAKVKEATADVADVYTAKNGSQWAFAERTPKKFRYNDVIKSQKEWLKDSDAMEEMIAGGLSWLKPYKKD